jgi:hypothetical protein
VQEPGECGPIAAHGNVPAELSGPADAAYQSAEPGRVHKRHARHVDQDPRIGRQLGKGLPELAHREGVELTDGPANDEPVAVLELNVEHMSSWSAR